MLWEIFVVNTIFNKKNNKYLNKSYLKLVNKKIWLLSILIYPYLFPYSIEDQNKKNKYFEKKI